MFKHMLVVILLCIPCLASAQRIQKEYRFTDQEAVELTNQLLDATDPDKPENEYMPSFLREKLKWVQTEFSAKRLIVNLAASNLMDDDRGRQVLMWSGYTRDGSPVIEISASRLLLLIRIQEKVAAGFNRMQKNTFALCLAHEAVHLEKSHESFVAKQSPERRDDFIREEVRAWEKIDRLAVSELLKKKEPVDVDFIQAHQILKNCRSNPCPALTRWLSDKTPQ